MPTPVLYESHMHTPLCKHARGEPEEYAAVAQQRGLAGITVTCHNPMPGGYSASVRMTEAQWPEYVACVSRAAAAWKGKVDVRLGLECDYAPGFEIYLDRQISRQPLSHVLGSVHPQVGEYIRQYFTGDVAAYHRTYFGHLAMAAETRLFDTLSHPDIVKNNHPDRWQLDVIWDDVLRALDRIAKTGVAMELNTSGAYKAIREMNPGPRMLQAMCERKIPVVLGADAHEPTRVGDKYREALDAIAAAGYREVSFFVDRKRRDVPIAEARASLA